MRVFQQMTFESFDVNGAPSTTLDERCSLAFAASAARDFAQQPEKWLCLHGPTGVGKTHLAAAVHNLRICDARGTTFRDVPELLHRMRYTLARTRGSTFYERFENLRNSELLILDDLIQPGMSDWALDTLQKIIAYRHDRLLPTIVTSRYILWEGADDVQWSRVRGKHQWESIRSRLNDSSVVTERLMVAPDYRNRGA